MSQGICSLACEGLCVQNCLSILHSPGKDRLLSPQSTGHCVSEQRSFLFFNHNVGRGGILKAELPAVKSFALPALPIPCLSQTWASPFSPALDSADPNSQTLSEQCGPGQHPACCCLHVGSEALGSWNGYWPWHPIWRASKASLLLAWFFPLEKTFGGFDLMPLGDPGCCSGVLEAGARTTAHAPTWEGGYWGSCLGRCNTCHDLRSLWRTASFSCSWSLGDLG